MTGFKNLMRYCNNIAEYEQAKTEGTVTDDVLVIVLEDKVAYFKGQTFDWSEHGGGDIYEWTLPEDATVTETENGADYTGSITQEELDAMINAKVLICNDGETGRFLFTDSQVSENTETGAKEYFGTTRTAIGFPFIDGAIVFSANDADLTFRLEMIIGNRADSEMSDTSYNPIANAVVKQYIDNAVSGASVTIDSEMSDSSANAVQNKVIKAYVDNAVANVDIDVDSTMSDSSTNPVQNKVVKAELDKKVDAVSGKQLSTEDFTSALKTKLEGLSNYDDTEISNAVDGLQTQINTLVSGDASTAIESFNEIVAFLSGLDDTESLESIIASIEQQIAGKQDLLVSGTNIKTINGESILGEGDIELDLSAYATKDEVIENEEVTAAAINDLKDRLGDFSADILDEYATKEELQNEISSLTEEVVLNEEITAAAINDLNDRVNDVYPNVAEIYSTKTEMASGFADMTEEVVTNEEVTASALNELNDRVSSCATLSDLDSKQDILVSGSTIKTINGNSLLGSGDITIEGGGGSGDLMTEIAYADLVALRDAGNLVAGMKYRITDYETKTAKAGSQSAGHPFDIIVTALDGSTLDEKASAIQSARDTDGYFANSKLEAWEVWYCLDNDTDRFDWAVKAGSFLTVDLSAIGAGEFNATPNGTFEYEGTTYYRWDLSLEGVIVAALTETDIPAIGDTAILYVPDYGVAMGNGTVTGLSNSTDNGFGVIYRLIDDKRNDVPYDFKNIQFVRKITDGALDLENGTDTWCYTFSDFSTGVLLDTSESRSLVFDNKFALYCWDNVFLGDSCYSNTFGNYCYSNTFGDSCDSNTFRNYCSTNTFGIGCSTNTFGTSCYSNTFGNYCSTNTFGDNCYSNTFGISCSTNTFGIGCSTNTFGTSCYSNTFGNYCSTNTFGTNCYSNTFGDNCESNTFGDNCYSNTFGTSCSTNTFATASDGSAIATYCSYNKLVDCSYCIIWNASGKIQRIEIKAGVKGASSTKQAIEIPVSNAFYVQTVAKNSSGEIKIYCEADLIA